LLKIKEELIRLKENCMNVIELAATATELDIDISYHPLRKLRSLSYPQDIFINIKYANTQKEKELIAHELGHCLTGCFYDSKVDKITRGKYEYRADCRAIQLLIPEQELKKALSSGYTEIWELAEHFEVSESFISKALKFYRIAQ